MANIGNTPEPALNLIIDKNHLVQTGFMSKYNLLEDHVFYNAYLNPTTNELTFQRGIGDVTISFSLTGLPDVDGTAKTSGSVLMYDGSNWVATQLGDVASYSNSNPSTRFNDILSVSSVPDALNKILYPYVHPSFPLFTILSKSTTLELGQNLSTAGESLTFQWGLTTIANISNTNGYKIADQTASYTLATAILPKTTVSQALTIPYAVQKTSNGATEVFRITGKDTSATFFQRDLTYTWRPRIFWGTSATATALNSTQIKALPSSPTGGSSLVSGIQNNFTMNGNGQYIWIAMPASFGYAINPDGSNSRFTVGGLANSFWNVFTVSFTNQQGYASSYYLYRSVSLSSGTNIKISIV